MHFARLKNQGRHAVCYLDEVRDPIAMQVRGKHAVDLLTGHCDGSFSTCVVPRGGGSAKSQTERPTTVECDSILIG